MSAPAPAAGVQAGGSPLAADLAATARIGAADDGAITRPAWSAALEEASALVAARLEELELETSRAGAGNFFARCGTQGGGAVLAGSHLDTVPRGGHLDGALGAIAAVEAVLRGEANHAATTPMDARRDALVGAARVALALREGAAADGALRATVGALEVAPGARNVFPGRCELAIDVRCADPARVAEGDRWVEDLVAEIGAAEGLEVEFSRAYLPAPTAMAPRVVAEIEDAARGEGVEPLRMPSGAGHDGMAVGRHCAAGLFVPSRGGISHSPREWTDPADCGLGARVVAESLRRLAA